MGFVQVVNSGIVQKTMKKIGRKLGEPLENSSLTG